MNLAEPELSVILCAHNPNPAFLARVLDALKRQTLPLSKWELVLIDNASVENLAATYDLSWHSNARWLREQELGLTAARVQGIRETRGDLIVLVDDDNVLDSDFLERARTIARDCPFAGVWSGTIQPEFEIEPPDELRPYLGFLAIRTITQDVWANVPSAAEAEPCGAGMCLRRAVALRYLEQVQKDPRRKLLDRKGTSLISGGDTDLAYTACEMGMAMGQFARLRLTHLIPSRRLTLDYILRLVEGISFSGIILRYLRGQKPDRSVLTVGARAKEFYSYVRLGSVAGKCHLATKRGHRAAVRAIDSQLRSAM